MKYLFLVFILFTSFSCKKKYDHNTEVFNIKNCNELDSSFINAQKIINKATVYCLFTSKNTDSLFNIIYSFKKLDTPLNKYGPLCKYWQGYCYLCIAACQLSSKKDVKTDSILNEGISLLNSIKNKNSEVYAILSLLNGISIKYCNITTLSIKAQKSKLCAEEAIKMNDKNMRAYLAFAINDFFTPSLYSGGKLVEKNLVRALKQNDIIDPNITCLPSWGRDMVFEYLIKSCVKNKKNDLANQYIKEALKAFPYRTDFKNLKTQ